jgi:hypothetical protein
VGVKCINKKKNIYLLLFFYYLIFIFEFFFQVRRDPHIADGYVVALVGLKCFKKKKNKKIKKLFYFILVLKNLCLAGPTHSHHRRWLCCSLARVDMFQEKD